MKVLFLRSCVVKGQHVEAGTIADLSTKIANELLGARRIRVLGDTDVEIRDPAIAIGDEAEHVIVGEKVLFGKKKR